jgi:pyruvate,water dikinase
MGTIVDDTWIIDGVAGERYPAWTRGNAADVFPDPVTPLMWTFYLRPGLGKGLRDAYIDFGVVDWDEIDHPDDPDMFNCFGGYFFNPLSINRVMGARMPGSTPEAIDKAYFDDHPDVPPYVEEAWHHSERHAAKLAGSMAWVMSAEGLPELDAEKALAQRLRAARPVLEELPEAALLARARSMVPYLQQMFETGMKASFGAAVGPGVLGAICESLGDPTMTISLLAGIDVDSAEPSFAMWDLSRQARPSAEVGAIFVEGPDGLLERLRASTSSEVASFVSDFDEFLVAYGSRGPNEWDLIAKVWETNPEIALAAIDRMRLSGDDHSPRDRHDASVAERARVEADIRERLAGDSAALETFDAALRSASVFLSGRERYKTACVKVVSEIRMCFRELGRRMVERGVLSRVEQIFMLLASELDAFRHEPERFSAVLHERDAFYLSLYDVEPIFIVNGSVPPLSTWPKRRDRTVVAARAGDVLHGSAGSGGSAEGRARVVLSPADPFALEPGDVLIAPNTDPSWTPLFIPAAAVVVEVGAMGSHAMIVCRELGIPCVASVADATRRIEDGATIRVDGNAGTVTIL